MIGTVRYYDAEDGYSVATEVTGEILAETSIVTIDTGTKTVMVYGHNVIHIEIEKES